jgi:hypothetical protein
MEKKLFRHGAAMLVMGLLAATFLLNRGVTFGGEAEGAIASSAALSLSGAQPATPQALSPAIPEDPIPQEEPSQHEDPIPEEAPPGEEAPEKDLGQPFALPSEELSLLAEYISRAALGERHKSQALSSLQALGDAEASALYESLKGTRKALNDFLNQSFASAQDAGAPSGKEIPSMHEASRVVKSSSPALFELEYYSGDRMIFSKENSASSELALFDEEYGKYRMSAEFSIWNPSSESMYFLAASFRDVPREAFSFLGNPAADPGALSVRFNGVELDKVTDFSQAGYMASLSDGGLDIRVSLPGSYEYSSLSVSYWLEAEIGYPAAYAPVSNPELTVQYSGAFRAFSAASFPGLNGPIPPAPIAKTAKNMIFLAQPPAENEISSSIVIKGVVEMPQAADGALPPSWTDMAALRERGEYKVSLLLDGYDYAKYNGINKDLRKMVLADLTESSSSAA